jgi:hypothetical protein
VKRRKFIYVFTGIISILFIYCAYAYNLPKLFFFSKENALKEWQEKIFRNRVMYVVKSEGDGDYLQARSEAACSGLFHKISFNSKKYPMMSWYWKVTKFPDKTAFKESKSGWIEKDDYAARVYVVFPSLNFMNIKSIEYIWHDELPEGTILTSPYFGNIKLIVAESGKDNAGKWVFEKRDIYEDAKRAFGKPPTGVGAIALMTDTDNTLSTAEAFYKDIKVGYKNGQEE